MSATKVVGAGMMEVGAMEVVEVGMTEAALVALVA